ncbi:hypothetical protein RND71_024867 [Anisodus tanguticus]|uniref:Uncharacterized protein n=1 Tax=Anisodus tanguticus TaxID=243964 RepID=A0AAE1RRV1_9SOLA|nr:hypothetical protein RND71_024867 [Anisodus tanguticus]
MDETDCHFAGIITAADEEELRNCPFTVEFENFTESSAPPSSSPVPSEQFGIIMLSLPVSDSIDQNSLRKNEQLQTPPEHHNSQTYVPVSDDQRPNTATAVDLLDNVSAGKDTTVDYGDDTGAQVRVDLGKDNDNLGFPKPGEIKVNRSHGDYRLDRFDEIEYSEGDFDEPLRKRIRICEKNLPMQSSIPQIVVNMDAEITDLEDEVVDNNRIKRNVDFAVTESEDGENHVVPGKKHANGIKKSCTAGVDRSIRGRRELPLWMRGGEKNGKVEDVGRKAMKKEQFKDIIEVIMEVFVKKNGESKYADFLETAKKRDMFFPRPRWWPPELYVD